MTAAVPTPHDPSRYLPISYSTAYESTGIAWTARCAGCGEDCQLHGDKHGVLTTDCPCPAPDSEENCA